MNVDIRLNNQPPFQVQATLPLASNNNNPNPMPLPENLATIDKQNEQIAQQTTLAGTDITGATMPTGGTGQRGWLSAIWQTLQGVLTRLNGTLTVGGTVTVANPTTNVTVSNFPATQAVSGPLTDAQLAARTLSVAATALPLPAGASTVANDNTIAGAPITGASIPSGGSGLIGWLSAIWTRLNAPAQDRTTPGAPMSVRLSDGTGFYNAGAGGGGADFGTAITGQTLPSGSGNLGWLSRIWLALTTQIIALVRNEQTAVTGTITSATSIVQIDTSNAAAVYIQLDGIHAGINAAYEVGSDATGWCEVIGINVRGNTLGSNTGTIGTNASTAYQVLTSGAPGFRLRAFSYTSGSANVRLRTLAVASPTFGAQNILGVVQTGVTNFPAVQAASNQELATLGTITTPTSAFTVDTSASNAVSIQVDGAHAGVNLTFEVSQDNVTYLLIQAQPTSGGAPIVGATGVLTANASLGWQVYCGGYAFLRVRATAWTSGTLNVRARSIAIGVPTIVTTIPNGTQNVAVTNSPAISNLPGAAAISDTLGNPTTTQIAADSMLWNGATWERQRGCIAFTLDTSAARTASGNGATALNVSARGAMLFFNITVATGTTPTIQFVVQVQDPVSLAWIALPGASTAVLAAAVGLTLLVLAPGTTAVANSVVPISLPRNWRIAWVIGGTTPSITFSTAVQYTL